MPPPANVASSLRTRNRSMAYEFHPDMADLGTPCLTAKALLVKLAVYAVHLGTGGAGVSHPSSGVCRYIHTYLTSGTCILYLHWTLLLRTCISFQQHEFMIRHGQGASTHLFRGMKSSSWLERGGYSSPYLDMVEDLVRNLVRGCANHPTSHALEPPASSLDRCEVHGPIGKLNDSLLAEVRSKSLRLSLWHPWTKEV